MILAVCLVANVSITARTTTTTFKRYLKYIYLDGEVSEIINLKKKNTEILLRDALFTKRFTVVNRTFVIRIYICATHLNMPYQQA